MEGRFAVTVRGERNRIKLLFMVMRRGLDLAQRLSIGGLSSQEKGASYREFFTKR